MTVRGDEVGASGAGGLGAGAFEMQHGQRAAHEALQALPAATGFSAKTLPGSTLRLIVRTISHRATSIIVVFACFI